MLNSRETAIAIWAAIAFGFALLNRDIRAAFRRAIATALQWPVSGVVLAMFIYTAGAVGVLYSLNLWTIHLLKDTLIWFAFSAVPLTFSNLADRSAKLPASSLLLDSLRFTVLVEFLVSEYTFSLPVELILIPVLTIVAALHAFAGTDEKYSPAAKLLNVIQAIFGLAILVFVITQAIADRQHLLTLTSARKLLLSPLMTILFLPFVYFALLWLSYDSLFTLLKLGHNKPKSVKAYARRRLLAYLGLRLETVRQFHHAHGIHLTKIEAKADVDELLAPTSE